MIILKLYLVLLICINLKWVTSQENSNIFVNRWIEDIDDSVSTTFCAHDGYLNQTCQCTTDYSGSNCLTRQCRNFGVDGKSFLRKDRCICPPGFLGKNCEPVRCVDGNNAVFQQSGKTVALLATPNRDMTQSWTNYNPIELICNYTSYTRIFSFSGIQRKVDPEEGNACNPKYSEDPCDNSICQPLELASLRDLVTAVPPNTIIFVVSNQKLDSTDDEVLQVIIASAIAKRVQINVVLYETITDIDSLNFLRNIATSTLGSFVKKGYEPEDAEISQGYQVIQALLQNFDNDIRPAALGLNANLPFQPNSDVYISGQTDYEQSLTIISSSNQAVEVVLSTTFWKLYRINASSLSFISVSGQSAGSQVIISTKDRLNVYSAFTTDKTYGTLEAAFPTTIAGSSYPLVSRFEYNGTVIGNYNDIRLYKGLLDSSLLNISNAFAYRSGCQFNFKTDATCQKSDIQFLYVLSSSNKPGIVPVYCLDKDIGISTYNSFLSTPNAASDFSIHQSYVDDAICSAEPAVNAYGKHSFVIISPNLKDKENSNLSSVDNLYRNPNSLFYQLYSYLKATNPNQYSNYIGALYSSNQINNLTVENTYEYFLTRIMNFASTSPDYVSGATPIDIIQHITSTLENINLKPFSDVFVILDSPFNNTTDKSTLLTQIQSKRIRLYILYVQTYSSLEDEDYIFLNDLVIRSSGGILSVLNSYDDVKQFFTMYTNYLVDNDLILSGFSKTPRAGISLNDANLVRGNSYLLLVTNRNPTILSSGSVNVTVSSIGPSAIPVTSLNNFGGIQLFSLDIIATGSYNISILGYSQLSNAIILELMTSQNYIGLTFANNQNQLNNSIGFNLGAFQPLIYSSFDVTLANSKVLITQTTDANPSVLVYNGPVINQTTCDSSELYNYATNFKWVCSQAGGLYRVKIDLVGTIGTITRTFPLTCATSTSSKCLNDGTFSDVDMKCVCALGWSGDICEFPVCLNGGSQTTGNTCQCSPGFSGSHCETSTSTCSNSPSSPDFRSDLSSLIIVAETNALKDVYLSNGVDLLGIPITVVTYSGSQASVVLTTTDGNLLSSVLNKNENADEIIVANTADNFNNALNVALDAQITDRSLLVVISSQTDLQVDTNTLIRLAAKRSEIRFITTTDVTDSLTTFSLIGNSIPITIKTADKLTAFFENYIVAIFNGLNSQKVFNVYETDFMNVAKDVTIPADSTDGSTDNIVLLQVFNGSWKAATKTAVQFNSGSYNLYVFKDVGTSEDFTLTLRITSGADKLYYSIERINYLNTAYGFSQTTDGTDEQLIIGARNSQNNVLSIYSAPSPSTLPSANPQELPYLEIREIIGNGSLDAVQTVLFTRKPTGCLYTHFSSLNICQKSGVLGYQVRLNTRNSRLVTKQQQFILTCHNTKYSNGDTSCGGNGSPNSICSCDSGFRGIDCKEPICVNDGVRDVSVCRCPVPYFGQRCETAEYTNQRAVAFVLDLVGADDYAYNETINTVKAYFKANTDDLYIMLIANVEPTKFDFKKLSEDDLNVLLEQFYVQRSASATANLTDALNQVSLSSLPNGTLVSANIFYLTQVGLDPTDNPTTVIPSLGAFKTSAVIYSPYGTTADSSISNSLKPFTSQTQNNNNYFDATKYLISVTDSNQYFIAPTDPGRTCAYALQANIIVILDLSNTTTPGVDDKKTEILTILRDKFNYINNDVDRCSSSNHTTPPFYKERSLFSVAYLWDNGFLTGNFCPSNYDSIWQTNNKGTNSTPKFSDRQLPRINNFINNAANCTCPRSTDDNTTKFLIWMPRASTETSENRISNMTYKFENSAQFVIPFYNIDATAESTDLYYNLVKQSKLGTQIATDYILPNAVTKTAQYIVSKLEQKMCLLAKIPGSI